MVLTVKERQRRYRAKLKKDPQRLEEFRAKERKRYHDNKTMGIVKLIDEKSARSQRLQRRRWKTAKQKQRQRRKDIANILTPPASPFQEAVEIPPVPTHSRQKLQSRKKRKRTQAKCYRENAILEKKLDASQRKVRMLRKRLQRMTVTTRLDSPRTKTKKLLRHLSKRKRNEKHCRVRRTLKFHYALVQQLREKYEMSSQKRQISEAVIGRVIRKYKLVKQAKETVGMNRRLKEKKGSKSAHLRKTVKDFFERDDNTRMSTGMKQTVTRNKENAKRDFCLIRFKIC